MVAPIVAAAAPTVIESAKSDTGLVNQLFKIGVLVGGLILLVISITILYFVFDLFGILQGSGNAILDFARKIPILGDLINVVDFGLAAITFITSAFGFLGRRGDSNRKILGF